MPCRPAAPVVWLQWPPTSTPVTLAEEGLLASAFWQSLSPQPSNHHFYLPSWQPLTMPRCLFSCQSSLFHFSNHAPWSHPKVTRGVYNRHIPEHAQGHDLVRPPRGEIIHFPNSLMRNQRLRETELLIRQELPICKVLAQKLSKHTVISPRPSSCLCPSISNKIPKEQELHRANPYDILVYREVASYVYLLTPWHLYSSALETQKKIVHFLNEKSAEQRNHSESPSSGQPARWIWPWPSKADFFFFFF